MYLQESFTLTLCDAQGQYEEDEVFASQARS